jgi:hypothetical protein
VRVEVSPGELFDKLAILQIKGERITEPAKVAHVRAELAARERDRTAGVAESDELARLVGELKRVNEGLWEVEDEVRLCERAGDFGERFVALARSVYRRNDERTALKHAVDRLLGAPFSEQKVYAGSG